MTEIFDPYNVDRETRGIKVQKINALKELNTSAEYKRFLDAAADMLEEMLTPQEGSSEFYQKIDELIKICNSEKSEDSAKNILNEIDRFFEK